MISDRSGQMRPLKPVPAVPDAVASQREAPAEELHVIGCRPWIGQSPDRYCGMDVFMRDPGGPVRRVSCNLSGHEDAYRAVLFLEGREVAIGAGWLHEHLANGYDFDAAQHALARRCGEGPPSVAFTLRCANVVGGGALMVYRYAAWLGECGVPVAIYSDSPAPQWMRLDCAFHHIPDPLDRFGAIVEDVVMAYSIFDLQDLLFHKRHAGRVVYHLCQGLEERHVSDGTFSSLYAPKPYMAAINALPVGRIVVSPHLAAYFRDNFGQRCHLIPNGVDTALFRPVPERKPIPGVVRLLTVGNPHHVLKGKADVLAAARLLAAANPDRVFEVDILSNEGGDPGPFVLKADNLQSHVRYALSPEAMHAAYTEATVCINASWYEGYGLPALEAMACGTPVVQCDNCGLQGVVVDEGNCLLVPPAKPAAMARAVERLMNDASLRDRVRQGGLATAAAHTVVAQHAACIAEFSDILGVSLVGEATRQRAVRIEAGEPGEDRVRHPLISVLMPTYNHEAFVGQALESLLAQTYPHWEVVAVDDGSTDGSGAILDAYASRDARIRVLHQPSNQGVGAALNAGVAASRGEWIGWLSSDDLFLPDALAKRAQAVEERLGIDFFHSYYSVLDHDSGEIAPVRFGMQGFIPPSEDQVIQFFRINYINGITVNIRREALIASGGFNPCFRNGQDFDMWLRLALDHRLGYLSDCLAVTRVHPAQGTALGVDNGIFDSAWALVAVLNAHLFPRYFPLLDLEGTRDAQHAVAVACSVLREEASFINRIGCGHALLGRLREWVESMPPAARHALRQAMAQGLDGHMVPPDVQNAWKRYAAEAETPFVYEPCDPLAAARSRIAVLSSLGRTREAASLERYITRWNGDCSRL